MFRLLNARCGGSTINGLAAAAGLAFASMGWVGATPVSAGGPPRGGWGDRGDSCGDRSRSRSSFNFSLSLGAPLCQPSYRPAYVPVCEPVCRPVYRSSVVYVPSQTVVYTSAPQVVYASPPPIVVQQAPQTVIVQQPVPVIQPAPVVYQPPPVVQVPPPPVASGIEVVPADLRASAYQTKDTIIVHVSGVNRAPGYTTSLSVRDPNDLYAPVVLLRNWAPVGEAAGSASVPFTLNATVRANHPLSTLTLRIGDQVLVVPVEPVQPINN